MIFKNLQITDFYLLRLFEIFCKLKYIRFAVFFKLKNIFKDSFIEDFTATAGNSKFHKLSGTHIIFSYFINRTYHFFFGETKQKKNAPDSLHQ